MSQNEILKSKVNEKENIEDKKEPAVENNSKKEDVKNPELSNQKKPFPDKNIEKYYKKDIYF